MAKLDKVKLQVRLTTYQDIPEMVRLSQKVYPEYSATAEELRGQISNFPEGQYVALYDGLVVGYCSTFIIKGEIALKPHTWDEITGDGFASRHDPDGDYLYGMEVCVDDAYRGLRIGQRLYDARKKLCQTYELQGIIFGGRLAGYSRRKNKVSGPEDYIQQVKARQIRDPAINFQLANGFEPIGILPGYLNDKDAEGFAALMLWRNPLAPDHSSKEAVQRGRLPRSVRVAAVQFQVREIESEEQFEKQIEYFVDVAADYRADFITFPELVTLPLLSIVDRKMNPEEAVRHMTTYTKRYLKFMQELAISYNINIIGGSHPTAVEGSEDIHNICYVFLRDGSIHAQEKLHPSSSERYWWNTKGGDTLQAIQTDCGPIGILISYDAEFPETARYLADQGALILFVPFSTDERQSYMRVRYCCQARAVENQVYVVMAGVVGTLPDVEDMDINYAESCILTPCDFAFARDGIASTAAPNSEMIAFADLQLENLIFGRNSGTVQNLKDRRFDLYRIEWPQSKKPIIPPST
jgi:predicted amidohydrolase/ribosomal protein S18 acetylase RimI-like enzyme